MGLIVDGVIVLIFGLCIYRGYKNGLAQSLLKIITSILAIIVAIVLYKPFVNFVIDNTLVDDNIQYSIEKVINQSGATDGNEIKEDSNVPKPIVKYLNNNLKNNAEEGKEAIVTEIAKKTARLIVMVGCIVVIFIIAKILLQLVAVLFDLFSKIPVIKQFNEIGGIIFGILQAFLIVLIILSLVAVITPLVGNNIIVEMVGKSFIGKWLYDSNILLNLMF